MKDQQSLFPTPDAPLAERMRPSTLSEVIGLENVWGPGSMIERALNEMILPSLVFWGPPGSGKTTLARILARELDLPFITFSAVTSGVKEIRAAIETADRMGRIVLFVDEIHRFNRGQQDAFLHAVEDGRILLMGATTENPSFELNSALLSRVKVITLPALDRDGLLKLLNRALKDKHGLDGRSSASEDALDSIATLSAGDARQALNLLEMCSRMTSSIDLESVRKVAERPIPLHDKSGEGHFNLISALHKSVRNSDPQASLYWLARMLIAGDDPLYVARRLMRAAVEDVGLADPHALPLAVATQQAVHFMGMPECCLALAELTVYLSLAPKSNAIYMAYKRAEKAAEKSPAEPVPMQIRNAPTDLMKELGYGEGYTYAHDTESGVAAMDCLPPSLKGIELYVPTAKGFEKEIRKIMKAIVEARESRKPSEDEPGSGC